MTKKWKMWKQGILKLPREMWVWRQAKTLSQHNCNLFSFSQIIIRGVLCLCTVLFADKMLKNKTRKYLGFFFMWAGVFARMVENRQ